MLSLLVQRISFSKFRKWKVGLKIKIKFQTSFYGERIYIRYDTIYQELNKFSKRDYYFAKNEI